MTATMPIWLWLICAALAVLGLLELIPFLMFIFCRKKYEELTKKYGR